jgi:hypothetical protein
MPLGDAGRKQMSDAMKAQLNSIGREHVPIAIVDAQKWLDALQSRGPIPEDAEATQQQLERFLRLDLATARTEKAVTVLQREVRRAILETQAELALQDKNETELKRLSTQVEKREADLLPKLELAADVFVDEIHDALVRFKHQTRAGLSKASNQFVEKLRIDTDLGHTQAMIRDAQHILQPEFEAVLADASRDLRQAMRLAGQKYEKEARALLAGLDIHDFSHWKQNQPGLAEIPAPVVILLDYLAVVLLLPLPIIADVLIRLLVDRFPQLQKLMPTGIAHALMVRQFEVGLRNQVTTSLREIEENLDKAFQKIRGEVNASVRKQIEGEVAPLRVAIQHVREKTSPSRRAALTQMHVSLGSLHGELLNLIPR